MKWESDARSLQSRRTGGLFLQSRKPEERPGRGQGWGQGSRSLQAQAQEGVSHCQVLGASIRPRSEAARLWAWFLNLQPIIPTKQCLLKKKKQTLSFLGALPEDTNMFWDVAVKYSKSPEAPISNKTVASLPF